MTVDSTADGVKIVTRQSIPASVLPSMVASMISGDPATERTEDWQADGDGYVAQFSVVVKGAPASIKGTMTLAPAGDGSTLAVKGEAAVPIPLFGSKIEAVIAAADRSAAGQRGDLHPVPPGLTTRRERRRPAGEP